MAEAKAVSLPEPLTIETWAAQQLEQLTGKHQMRHLHETVPLEGVLVHHQGKELINFSGNDYLGLSRHPDVVNAAVEALYAYGAGAGASRLVTGNHPIYSELEQQLARLRGTEAALVFASGYHANIGVIPALMGRNDLILLDKLVHACILDGARLSGATIMRFNHNDVAHVRQLLEKTRSHHGRCLLVTDAVFSMDGDLAPVEELSALCRAHDAWLMTDDAHGLGLCADDLDGKAHLVDVQMGTLSKVAGSFGGYVCAKRDVINLIANTARSFMFSTALPPAVVAASVKSLDIIEFDRDWRLRPLDMARHFSNRLGLATAQSPIVPIVVGKSDVALYAARTLMQQGFLVTPIRPPTVPEGSARLRVTFSALHKMDQVDLLALTIHSQPWFRECVLSA